MSFLLDTDICSAYLKNDAVVVGRVMMTGSFPDTIGDRPRGS